MDISKDTRWPLIAWYVSKGYSGCSGDYEPFLYEGGRDQYLGVIHGRSPWPAPKGRKSGSKVRVGGSVSSAGKLRASMIAEE